MTRPGLVGPLPTGGTRTPRGRISRAAPKPMTPPPTITASGMPVGRMGCLAAALVANRLDQIVLGHLAATGDVQVPRPVVELVARPLVERPIRIAGAHRAAVGRAALFAAPLVDRAGRDLLRPILGHAAVFGALLDGLVLPPVLVAPGWHAGRNAASMPGPELARPEGLEPPTHSSEGCCSI